MPSPVLLHVQDDEVLDKEAVALGEACMKGGMAFFASDVRMILHYSNYLIEVSWAHVQLLVAG